MPLEIPNAVFCPDLDASNVPGGIVALSGFAPLQTGQYAAVSTNEIYGVVSGEVLHTYAYRTTADATRFLVFTDTDCYEYDDDGTETVHTLGASSSTTGWSSAAWGNKVFVCNKLNYTLYSEGVGGDFFGVGDDCPKARFVASNLDFVMLADTDDGVDDLPDRVWWSALQDPTEWTPSIATQAGNNRLLDVSGPITALRAFRDGFIVAKRNCLYWGEYVGGAAIFQWRLVSSRIGVVSNNAVVEIDDKLVFVHDSGVFQRDGSTLTNVGLPVWRTILNNFGYNAIQGASEVAAPGDDYEGTAITDIRLAGDDVDGVVWLSCYTQKTLDSKYYAHAYGYNARAQKWSKLGSHALGTDYKPVWVNATTADMRTLFGGLVAPQARVWFIDNKTVNYLCDLRYPDAWDNDTLLTGSVSMAPQGSRDGSSDALRVYYRCLYGTSVDPFGTCTVKGYANEPRTVGEQTATFTLNSELDCFDGRMHARYKMASLYGADGKQCILAGVGIEYPPMGRR